MTSKTEFYGKLTDLLDRNLDVYGKIIEFKQLIKLILNNGQYILTRYSGKYFSGLLNNNIFNYRNQYGGNIHSNLEDYQYISSNENKIYNIHSKKGQIILANYLYQLL